MKVSIIHLSDIHFSNSKSGRVIFSKIDSLVNRVHPDMADADEVYLVFSGDIANTGVKAEYGIAGSFIKELKDKLKSKWNKANINVIIVPGNHDCDFSISDSVRDSLIGVVSGGSSNNIDEKFIQTLLAPQREWQSFAISSGIPVENVSHLSYSMKYSIDGYKIQFNCFNTAWMSKLHETQGALVFPLNQLHEVVTESDISISVFHHPYNWLQAANAREFRDFVEKSSDLILTGHEHSSRGVNQTTTNGYTNHCFEGAVLQNETNQNQSGFNHVLLDLSSKTLRMISYDWGSGLYNTKSDTGVMAMGKTNHSIKRKCLLSDSFNNEFLTDPGTQFTHRKHGNVRLDNIFIWPNFQKQDFSKKGVSAGALVAEKEMLNQLSQNHTYFVGSSNSGKTTLAKKVFQAYYENLNAFPLLIKGADVKSCSEDKCKKVMSHAISEQYIDTDLDKYLQLNVSEKVVMVDDFHKIQLNLEGRKKFISFLLKSFGKIVVFGEDFSQFRELIEDNQSPLLSDFDIFEIKELSFLQRSEMIKSWFGYDTDYSSEPAIKAHDLSEKERLVDSILRKNLIPAYPLFILTILQTFEAGESLKTAEGTYGYYYEALITMAIAKKISSKHIDKYYAFLAALSYEMYSANKTELSYEEIVAFTERYREAYAVTLKTKHIIDDFVAAKIIIEQNALYSFRYRYVYFYFVARYISQNMDSVLNQSVVKEQIRKMAKTVYTGDSANILIFLSYLSKNPFIQEEIIANSKEIFKSNSECDLEKIKHFVFAVPSAKPTIRYDEGKDIETARRENHQLREKNEAQTPAEIKNNAGSDKPGMSQINVAFKTIEILGQIVRNFSGSLPAESKIKSIEECYSLGLRSLSAFLNLIEGESELIRTALKDSLEKHGKKFKTEEELNEALDTYMFYLGQAIINSFVKRISYAIGSNELEEVYRRVLSKHNTNTYKLLDIAVRIEHLLAIPHKDIINFYKGIESDSVLATSLKIIVVEHFYLFPCDRNIRVKICDTLDIRRNSPKMIETSGKKYMS